MKIFLQKMAKASLILMGYYIMQAIIFAAIFTNCSEFSFKELLIFELAGKKDYSIKMNTICSLIIAVQNVMYTVVISVFASYAYACYVYRSLPILFPPKLVIRHRTNGKLCLGVLIGNKHRAPIHDLECTLTCRYLKDDGGINREFKLKDCHTIITNYYRFSFEVSELPKELMKTFIYKDSKGMEEDEILVTLSGIGYANNKFYEKRNYTLSEIVIDEHIPQPEENITNPFTGKVIRRKINWKKLYKEEEVSELKRKEIIEEIRKNFKK